MWILTTAFRSLGYHSIVWQGELTVVRGSCREGISVVSTIRTTRLKLRLTKNQHYNETLWSLCIYLPIYSPTYSSATWLRKFPASLKLNVRIEWNCQWTCIKLAIVKYKRLIHHAHNAPSVYSVQKEHI